MVPGLDSSTNRNETKYKNKDMTKTEQTAGDAKRNFGDKPKVQIQMAAANRKYKFRWGSENFTLQTHEFLGFVLSPSGSPDPWGVPQGSG